MLKILKASAGSGKTFSLAKEYIRLLVASDSPDAYRHVLAVTFTNKATDEMKRRILQELDRLAQAPEDSPYFQDLVSPRLDRDTLQRRARTQLFGILHDYSSFAVSTIDRFFQQALRAFAREIGQYATYQVQLDRQALVGESVDRVLDGLTEEDRVLLDWLTRGVKDDLENGRGLSLEARLQEVGQSLQELPEDHEGFSRERLEVLHRRCQAIRKEFPSRAAASARAVLQVLQDHGISPQESNGGFLKALYNYLEPDPRTELKDLTPAFRTKAADPAKWFAKSRDALRLELEGSLEEPLDAFCALFGQPYREYRTARIIQGQLYSLGVADELRQAFVQIQKEKNVLSLEDANTILRGIIDGTDAPFVYEKLGVRFQDFLLDEFQDTSRIQWENFSPLLHNAEASGFDSLVVGDVKQSIYRWRGSDWDLLGSRLREEFGPAGSVVETLGGNYRSCRTLVDFNNRFFAFASGELDRLLGGEPLVAPLYADVAQQPCLQDPNPGWVEVLFLEDQLGEIVSTLRSLEGQGALWGDVAILVRDNRSGAEIAARLVQEGIPVVSDDALYVKASVTVRRLVSQMTLCYQPDDPERPSVAGYLAASLAVRLPEHFHSLTDLSESILRDLREADPERFRSEIPYIQSFMDYLQDWVATGGNNLGAFLRSWEEADPRIASPQTGHSVRILTVHKAKGLEFPFVIFPFAEKVGLYKNARKWCASGEDVFYVDLGSGSASTLFEADYRRESRLQAVDNINVFYVAMTRPRCGLKVISAPPSRTGVKTLADLLYAFVGGTEFRAGEPYPFRSLERPAPGARVLEADYPSFPSGAGNRLRISPEAADYFGPDGSVGPEASPRIRGNVLHRILSDVQVPEDLPAAVEAAVRRGELPSALRSGTLSLLEGHLKAVEGRGWFAPGAAVRREAAILSPDGGEYRPDRVVLFPDGSAQVVDYKFGAPQPGYARQVERYKSLYRQMGYAPVRGFLWYLQENPGGEIVEV